jgi:hypothetical protein
LQRGDYWCSVNFHFSLAETIMIKRVLLLVAAAGIYLWARRQQEMITLAKKDQRDPEADWANEGGRNPSPSV